MRGTARWADAREVHHRFIPAHAGNSTTCSKNNCWTSVHPRACGEQCVRRFYGGFRCGSSPRMRGTVGRVVEHQTRPRFIPAHAGNRTQKLLGYMLRTVHPRACGEQSVDIKAPNTGTGSSPRMRGTVTGGLMPKEFGRFIPAHAGNSKSATARVRIETVHPRACGEQICRTWRYLKSCGSSPRMRGTVAVLRRIALIPRFIPAHAGNRARNRAARRR